METIPFILEDAADRPAQADSTKSIFGAKAGAGLAHVPVDRLRDNLARLTESVSQAFADAGRVGDFQLEEITLQVEVNAEGGVALIGSAKVGGKGAITLRFRRPDAPAQRPPEP